MEPDRPNAVPDLERLADQCDWDTFRSSGPGGQNVNKRDTAVRLVHRPTGLSVTSQEERSQLRNRQRALEKLRELLEKRNRRRKPRRPTRKSRAVKERILKKKKQRSEVKKLRKDPKIQ